MLSGPKISLHWRIAGIFSVLLGLTLLIEFFLTVQNLREQNQQELASIIATFTPTIEQALWEFDNVTLNTVVLALASRSDVAWARIDANLRNRDYRIEQRSQAQPAAVCERIFDVDFSRTTRDNQQLTLGSLSVCRISGKLAATLTNYSILAMLLVIFSLGMSGLLIFMVVHRALLRPISLLIHQLRAGKAVADLELDRDSWDRDDDLDMLYRELVGAAGALRTEYAIAQSTLHAISDGVIILDRELQINRRSDSIYEIFAKDIENDGGFELWRILPRDCLEKQGVGRSYVTEAGTHVEVIVSHLPSDGYAIVVHDLTRQHHEIQEAMKQNRLSSVGTLASGIAHDFNNFLSIILGNTELLRLGPIGKQERQYVDAVHSAATSAAAVTAKLLTYSSSGTSDEYFQPHEVIEMVNTLVPSSRTMNINWKTRVDSQAWIRGDIRQMSSAILNLVLNALDATEESGRVFLGAEDSHIDDRKAVSFVVTDDGTGFPGNKHLTLMEPFATTKPQGQGVGLGLTMVKAYIDSVGGKIQIESIEGIGTHVNLLLPAVTDSAIMDTESRRTDTEKIRGLRVLIIEDMLDVARSFCDQLSRLGVQADILYVRQNRAWEDVAFDQYSIVICDVLLGGFTALDVLEHVESRYAGRRPAFIFVSGNIPRNLLKPLQSVTRARIVMKPVGMATLVENISRLVMSEGKHNELEENTDESTS